MEVDGPAHACWARATVLCEARSRGACDAMQTDLFLEPDTLSTNLFFLSLSLVCQNLFLSFWTLMDGRAPILSGAEARPARVWCEARAQHAPGTCPARARHTMKPTPICRARDTFYQPSYLCDTLYHPLSHSLSLSLFLSRCIYGRWWTGARPAPARSVWGARGWHAMKNNFL